MTFHFLATDHMNICSHSLHVWAPLLSTRGRKWGSLTIHVFPVTLVSLILEWIVSSILCNNLSIFYWMVCFFQLYYLYTFYYILQSFLWKPYFLAPVVIFFKSCIQVDKIFLMSWLALGAASHVQWKWDSIPSDCWPFYSQIPDLCRTVEWMVH